MRPDRDHRCRRDRPEGTPAALKEELRRRRGLQEEPTLDDVFMDATGRAREQVAGEVREVRASASSSLVLGQRAVRETLRTPDSLIPTLFIPLFFLVVNVGQAARIFPGDVTLVPLRPELRRLPAPGVAPAGRPRSESAALYLVEEIEGGYFDKLPCHTDLGGMSIVMGRLYAEFGKTLALSTVMILIAFLFDVHMAGGVAGFVVLCGSDLRCGLSSTAVSCRSSPSRAGAPRPRRPAASSSPPALCSSRQTSCPDRSSRGRWRSQRRSTR